MPRRRNFDLEKIRASTETTCPHCGSRIEPKDYKRVDGEHLECLRCGKLSLSAITSGVRYRPMLIKFIGDHTQSYPTPHALVSVLLIFKTLILWSSSALFKCDVEPRSEREIHEEMRFFLTPILMGLPSTTFEETGHHPFSQLGLPSQTRVPLRSFARLSGI